MEGRIEYDGEQDSAKIASITKPCLSTVSQGKVELAHMGSCQWFVQGKRVEMEEATS